MAANLSREAIRLSATSLASWEAAPVDGLELMSSCEASSSVDRKAETWFAPARRAEDWRLLKKVKLRVRQAVCRL